LTLPADDLQARLILHDMMNRRIIQMTLFALLLFADCSDTVTKHYSTRNEAEEGVTYYYAKGQVGHLLSTVVFSP